MATKQAVLQKLQDDMNSLSSTVTLDIAKSWAMMVNAYKELNETVSVSGDSRIFFGVDAGSSDAYAFSVTGYTAYENGDTFIWIANTENTGACSLNVAELGAITLKKSFNEDLETGDILAGQILICAYDADNSTFQMLGGLGSVDLSGLVEKSIMTAKGDIFIASDSATPDNLGVGSDGQVLTADSNETLGVKWATPESSSSAPVVADLTDGATITCDLSTGDIFFLTLGGNRNIDIQNPTEGKLYLIYVKQDATGGRTLTWDFYDDEDNLSEDNIIWKNDQPPILSLSASVVDIIQFRYVKDKYYGSMSEMYYQ